MRPASVLSSIVLATLLELLATATAVQAEEIVTVGDNRLGIRTAPVLLLTRADVQTDLKLSRQQAAEARQVISALRNRAAAAKQEAEKRQIEHDMTEWLKTHLSPQQFDRLHQIDLQWEGIFAVIRRPIVAEYIHLTDVQKTALATMQAQQSQARAAQPPTFEAHLALTQQGLTVLSPAQQTQWHRLLGAPCRFTISGQPAVTTPPVAATPATTPLPLR